jgi:Cytochrome C oxidase, cbb3-type, subunit III
MTRRSVWQTRGKRAGTLLMLLLPLCLFSCRQDMHDQAKYKPLAASDFFGDGRASRPLVEGTIARGQLDANQALYTGKAGKDFVTEFPMPVTAAFLARGQQRYNIYCTPCHDQTGYGHGMVVKRGFKAPPSFHIDRLREAPVGYYFDVMTNGFGTMLNYSQQVRTEDRWAIAAYIRALQLSQHATLADVPTEERQKLETEK